MVQPIPGYGVTTPYGQSGSWSAGYHTGQDHSTHGETGKRVNATKDGKVVIASQGGGGWGESYGKHVVINSGGVHHGYCHLSGYCVSVGQTVDAGQKIGSSGNTGNSTGPHLHYEERTDPHNYNAHDRKPQFPGQGDQDEESQWASGKVYVEKLEHRQQDSDSVARLCYRLRNHNGMPASHRPPHQVRNYTDEILEAVRYWQRNIKPDVNGPSDGTSMSNPQANTLFGDNYNVIEE